MKCAKCGYEVCKDAESIWRSVPSGRASCKHGGPHKVVVDVEVDWEKFGSVLDQWTNDAL